MDWPEGMSIGHFPNLLVNVARPSLLWPGPSLGRQHIKKAAEQAGGNKHSSLAAALVLAFGFLHSAYRLGFPQ